jgi:hypothetical protein
MKKIVISVLAVIFTVLFYGCSRDDILTNPVKSTQGIFVLYEGGSTAGSGDYSFINVANDSVFNDVYQNSNQNSNLGLFPDGLALSGTNLFVTSQGSYGGPGKIFKINSADNKLVSSAVIGTNPYDFVVTSAGIFVTNTSSDYVTKLDLNLGNPTSIPVGSSPSKIIFAHDNVFVAKQSYTMENSLAIINPSSLQVNKVFFSSPPVSVESNMGGIYVSTFTSKKLYVLDTNSLTTVIDSVVFSAPQFTNSAIGEVVAGDASTLYVVGLDTSAFYSTGKAVYKVNIPNKSVSVFINDPAINDIYGIAYDAVNGRVVIADSRFGVENGQVRVYNNDGSIRNNYTIGGKFPRKIAFKY